MPFPPFARHLPALLAALALLVALPTAASAQGSDARAAIPSRSPGFVEIDRQRLEPGNDRFVLRPGRDGASAAAIKLRAMGAGVFVRRVTLVYASGETREERIGETVAPGQETRLVEVERERGALQEVVVVIRPLEGEETARLDLLAAFSRGDGARTAGPMPPATAPSPPPSTFDRRVHADPGAGRRLERPDAGPGDLDLIGSVRVAGQTTREVVAVGRDRGRLDAIRLRVRANDVLLRRITIVYGNGEREDLPVDKEVPEGTLTPPLALRGTRFVREIEIVAQSNPERRRPAAVEVFAAAADGAPRARAAAPPDTRERFEEEDDEPRSGPPPRDFASRDRPPHDWAAGDWTLLGAKRAGMLDRDHDTIAIGPRFGRIGAIKIVARRNAVRLYWVRVVYADGESEHFDINSALRDGGETAPIDLAGRRRIVDRVELAYRSKINLRGEAQVEVWGVR